MIAVIHGTGAASDPALRGGRRHPLRRNKCGALHSETVSSAKTACGIRAPHLPASIQYPATSHH
jgi:hypothetical protein